MMEAMEAGWSAWQATMSRAHLFKEVTKASLLDMSAPIRRNMLHNVRDMFKFRMVADPDMWQWFQTLVRDLIDQIWKDVEHEIERSVATALLEQDAADCTKGPSGGLVLSGWCRVRASVLRHYIPHNVSIFGKLQDPGYLLILVPTLLPIHGLRVAVFSAILFMLLWPGPPDEYQLLNFILVFKGLQFFTSGVSTMAVGAMQYFYCYSSFKDDILGCIDSKGPGAFDPRGQLVDYLGSIVLVWIAFLALPRSKKLMWTATFVGRGPVVDDAEIKGGRMRRLLNYDVACFVWSLTVLAVTTIMTCDVSWDTLSALPSNPQFRANIFWCRVLYSLLALPFLLFKIPVLATVLTHAVRTGYNEHGACVAWELPADLSLSDEERDRRRRWRGPRTYRYAEAFNGLLREGLLSRGGDSEAGYQFGDLTRGIWARLAGSESNAASVIQPEPPPPQLVRNFAQPSEGGLLHPSSSALQPLLLAQVPEEGAREHEGMDKICAVAANADVSASGASSSQSRSAAGRDVRASAPQPCCHAAQTDTRWRPGHVGCAAFLLPSRRSPGASSSLEGESDSAAADSAVRLAPPGSADVLEEKGPQAIGTAASDREGHTAEIAGASGGTGSSSSTPDPRDTTATGSGHPPEPVMLGCGMCRAGRK